jgi:hypothetical protein
MFPSARRVTHERLAREILGEADRVDRDEDELYGEARGDEAPARVSDPPMGEGWLREAKQRLPV